MSKKEDLIEDLQKLWDDLEKLAGHINKDQSLSGDYPLEARSMQISSLQSILDGIRDKHQSLRFPREVKPRFHYAIRELMQEGYENAILNQRCAVSPSSQEAEDEIDSDSDPNSPFYGLTSSEKDKLMEAIHKDDQPRSVIKGRTLRSRKDIKNDRRG